MSDELDRELLKSEMNELQRDYHERLKHLDTGLDRPPSLGVIAGTIVPDDELSALRRDAARWRFFMKSIQVRVTLSLAWKQFVEAIDREINADREIEKEQGDEACNR